MNAYSAYISKTQGISISPNVNWEVWRDQYLKPSERVQKLYDQFVEGRNDFTLFEDMREFPAWLVSQGRELSAFPYGEDIYPDGNYDPDNTYNYPDAFPFDTTLFYNCFYIDDIFVYIISEHMGGDVRNNRYTEPKVYEESGYGGELSLFMASLLVYCDCSNTHLTIETNGYVHEVRIDGDYSLYTSDLVYLDGETASDKVADSTSASEYTSEELIAAMIYDGIPAGSDRLTPTQRLQRMEKSLGLDKARIIVVGSGYENNLHCPVCGDLMKLSS